MWGNRIQPTVSRLNPERGFRAVGRRTENKAIKHTTALFLVLAFWGSWHLAQATPTITAQPLSRSNHTHDNAQFTVTATGSGTLSDGWKLNNVLNLSEPNASQAQRCSRVVIPGR